MTTIKPADDQPLPEFIEWERLERSRMIGYIFGLLDAVPNRLERCVGLEDGIEISSPWSGEIWKLRLERTGATIDDDGPDEADPPV